MFSVSSYLNFLSPTHVENLFIIMVVFSNTYSFYPPRVIHSPLKKDQYKTISTFTAY